MKIVQPSERGAQILELIGLHVLEMCVWSSHKLAQYRITPIANPGFIVI